MTAAAAAPCLVVLVASAYLIARRDRLTTGEFAVGGAVLLVALVHARAHDAEHFDAPAPAPAPASTPASTPVSADTSTFVSKVVAIPGQIKATIVPALDNLVNSVQGKDANGNQQPAVGGTMSSTAYTQDPACIDSSGAFSQDLYATLVGDYQAVDKMLDSMKGYNSALFNAIVAKSTA